MNPRTEGTAIASLILALLSAGLGPLGFVPAIVCGHIARARIRNNPELSGEGLALAGLIIGYVFVGVIFLAIVFFVLATAA